LGGGVGVLAEDDAVRPSQRPPTFEGVVHELLHHMHPEWVEEEVERHGEWLGKILWRQGYRRVKS
jgi:hypothetical protein